MPATGWVGFQSNGLHEFLQLGERSLITVVNGVIEKRIS